MFPIIYQGASEIWKIIKDLLLLPVRHCAFFILISTDELQSLGGEIMAYHLEEEIDAAIQLSVVRVFSAPESGPVGIVQGF